MHTEEEDEKDVVASAKEEEEEEKDIVAVGAVSHVIRRAFHRFYAPNDVSTASNEENEKEINPFVVFGDEKKREIAAKTREKHTEARALLSFFDAKYKAAQEKDEAIAHELSQQGLVIKAQIPMGPSNLQLTPNDVPSSWLTSNLVFAHELVASYEQKKRERTGNDKVPEALKMLAKERPGYLNTTFSTEIRKQMHTKPTLNEEKEEEEEEEETVVFASKPAPAVVMTAAEKRRNMEILNKMQRKLEFLRNPRFAPSKKKSRKPSPENEYEDDDGDEHEDEDEDDEDHKKQSPCFVVLPNPIAFKDYDVGGVYEQTVLLRNNSALSRRLRVLPPATMYFSIDRIVFPDTSGLIAPGMSVQVVVRFAPDSRADYKDTITVQYESPELHVLKVPLIAHREPPELTIPLVLRAHNTLVGNRSKTTFQCLNKGGKGRFWLMSEKEWTQHEANLTFRATSQLQLSGAVRVGPFQLKPNEFELDTNEFVTFELLYVPTSVGEQREKFVMVCDNCLVRVFQLIGRGCQVEIHVSAVNGKVIDTGITHMADVEHVFFPEETLVQTSTQQQLVLQNDTPIELPFVWTLHPPASSFTIVPGAGVFPKNGSMAFTITFAPADAQVHESFAVLSIQKIPACAMPGPHQLELLAHTFEKLRSEDPMTTDLVLQDHVDCRLVQLHGVSCVGTFALRPSFLQLPQRLQRHQWYQTQTMLENETHAPLSFAWDLSRVVDVVKRTMDIEIVPSSGLLAPLSSVPIAIRLRLMAVGPFHVSIPCQLTTGGRYERWVRIEGNVEQPTVEFLISEVDFGLLSVGAVAEVSFSFRNPTSAAGSWRLVHLEADVSQLTGATSPSPNTNTNTNTNPLPMTTRSLKRVNSKDSVSSRHSVSSTTSSDRSGSLFTARDTLPKAVVTFAPDHGTIGPGQVLQSKAICSTGSLPERFRGSFAIQLTPEPLFSGKLNANAAFVSARAEIQSPNVYLTPTKLWLGTTYMGVSVRRTLQLINLSNLSTTFKMMEPMGPSKAYSVEFFPKSGKLESKQELSVTMVYTPRQAGKTSTLLAAAVHGLSGPLGFEVGSNQKGLVLSYELAQSSPLPPSPKELAIARGLTLSDCDLEPDNSVLNVPKLQFGDAIPLGERRTLAFLIRNFSGIDATIEIEAKRHPAAKLPPSTASVSSLSSLVSSSSSSLTSSLTNSSNSTKSKKSVLTTGSPRKRKVILGAKHESAQRFQSSNGQKYLRQSQEALEDRLILSHGHGIAFQVTPSVVKIPPWEQVVVHVTCFNNMPGVFQDDVVCRVAGAPPVFLHALASIDGMPLVLERNCVGLYFPKKLVRQHPTQTNNQHQNQTKPKDPTQTKTKSKAIPSELLNQPTLHFGQLCVGSAPVTKTIRVVNRGPKAAKLKWKLVEAGKENQLVHVTLHVDFSAKVQVRIIPAADDDDDLEFPFEIAPASALVPAFTTVAFSLTYTPSETTERARLLLLGDAYWIDPMTLEESTPLSAEGDGQRWDLATGSANPTSSSAGSSSSELKRMNIAAGKALKAVRAANTVTRRTPANTSSSASSVSKKCIRLLLAADVIAPELYLDQHVNQPSTPTLSPYQIKFTTWSTIVADPSSGFHAFHRRELTLINHFNSRLTFRLECTGPFSVFRADSLAPKHPLSVADLPPAHRRAEGESFMFMLPPRMSVRLELRFDVSNSALATAAKASLLPTTSTTTKPRLKQQIDGQLLVHFTNQSTQTIHLIGEILRPMVCVTPSIHHFGHVHLLRTRSVVLRLTNPTVVPADVQIRHVPLPVPVSRAQKQDFARYHAQSVDDPSVFAFETMQITVQGPTLSLASSGSDKIADHHPLVCPPIDLRVVFHPKATAHYRSRFRFVVPCGNDFEIVLDGHGHLHEYEIPDQERTMVKTSLLDHTAEIYRRYNN